MEEGEEGCGYKTTWLADSSWPGSCQNCSEQTWEWGSAAELLGTWAGEKSLDSVVTVTPPVCPSGGLWFFGAFFPHFHQQERISCLSGVREREGARRLHFPPALCDALSASCHLML